MMYYMSTYSVNLTNLQIRFFISVKGTGAGGGLRSILIFLIVSYGGEWKNIVPSQNYRFFKLHCAHENQL